MLNLEFLHCGNIIPEDWNVIRPPVNTQQSAQLIFQNGVSLTAQLTKLVLWSRSPPRALNMRAGINLAYGLDERQLYISINEVMLQREVDTQATLGLMFLGNFEYRLEPDAKGDRPGNSLAQGLTILENWQADLTFVPEAISLRRFSTLKFALRLPMLDRF